MEQKSEQVRRLVAAGDYQSALRIAKNFRRGICKEDSEAMVRGHECLSNPRFYKSLGMDTDQIIQKGLDTVQRLYGV